MGKLKFWILGILAAVMVLVAIVMMRTAALAPEPVDSSVKPLELSVIDAGEAAKSLSKAIQFKTVTDQDPAKTDWTAFTAFQDWLKIRYPEFHAAVQSRLLADYTPYHVWQGRNPDLNPMVFLAHQDVVPAIEDDPGWIHPPFAGLIADGFIHGRGAIDDKGSLIGIMEAANNLAARGYQPERTLIFVFGHDEEVLGSGAKSAAQYMKDNGITPEAVIDEGGAMITGLNGVSEPVAMIGVTEKGYFTVRVTARARGGHSSAPAKVSAIGSLSRAIIAIEENPFDHGLNDVTTGMLKAFAPKQGFKERMAIANLWLFKGSVEAALHETDATRTMLGTSIAPTIINAGVKENALPREASALVNLRVHPRDSHASVLAHLRKAVNNPDITIEPTEGEHTEPAPISPIGTGTYKLLEDLIQDVFPGRAVAPNMLAGGTDSRYFVIVTPNIYRFAPFDFEMEDMTRAHGLNERMSVEGFARGIAIYEEMFKRAGASPSKKPEK